MRQTIKHFLCILGLAWGVQSAWAFSLLGPVGSAGTTGGTVEDNWQVTDLGYDPLPNPNALPRIGTTTHTFGPKRIGEGYRCNTPVLYYTFDPDFADYFGADGEAAVGQAFDMLNGVLNGQTNTPMFIVSTNTGVLMNATNGMFNGPSVALGPANGLDKYSTNLTEFPLNSQAVNYQANVVGLTDLKSTTLSLMLEQLGLADAVRYTWGLLDRWVPAGVTCTPTTPPSLGPVFPSGVDYWVIQRNLDIVPSALTNYQYSPYVNTELYTYFIWETCSAAGFSPPIADALAFPVDPLNYNPPVASGVIPGAGIQFNDGIYYTGLTRDDVAGLRYLLSTNNIPYPSQGYLEPSAAGSSLFGYTGAINPDGTTNYLYTSNYYAVVPAAPANGSLVVNSNYLTTTYRVQTITVGPPIGWPADSPFVTNVTLSGPLQSNVVSGDYFVITNGGCPPSIVQTLQTNVNIFTNLVSGVTNADGSSTVQNVISYFTNYVYLVQPCSVTTGAVADYQGIGRMQFIRVSDGNYDYQNGQFYVPITNEYSMVVITNHQFVTRTFQRVVTRPDIIFGAQDLLVGSGNADLAGADVQDTQPNFIDSRAPNLAGPGIIDPTSATISITFNATGPVFDNTSPEFTGPNELSTAQLNWASFDGTTNAPIVYPNGTSLANLAAEAFIQISPPPPALPNGTNGVAYNAILTATGGQPPYTWMLATNSAGLPPGLILSSGGVISGTPSQSGTFDNIVIQMTDSSVPSANVVNSTYSLTIN